MFIKKKSKTKEEFEAIIKFATKVHAENPSELSNLIKLLGSKVQLDYLTYILKHENDYNMKAIEPRNVWFDPLKKLGSSNKSLYDLSTLKKGEFKISLTEDLVLTNPWNRQRMLNAYIHHGENRIRGAWRQDSNHFAELWLPMKIAWVGNGNHSIAAGIVQRDGFLYPQDVYDISPVYDFVQCDGDQFIDIENDRPISSVRNVEFCAIYEVGRLLLS